jgi:hypothetical protein
MPDPRPHAPYCERTATTGPPPRLRVLPVPTDPHAFLVVFDRVPLAKVAAYSATADDMKAKTGAAGIIVVPDEIDVPQADDPREVF